MVFSYYLGKWNGASICRNVSNIQFVEVEEIDDTTYYTGKDVSHYMYSPTRFNEGVIPDASTAAKIAFADLFKTNIATNNIVIIFDINLIIFPPSLEVVSLINLEIKTWVIKIFIILNF